MPTYKTYKTPGVYVEEISTLPPSVAEVSTAIPAFIGYTEKRPQDEQVARINTLLEYEDLFGKAKPSSFTVKTPVDPGTKQVSRSNNSSTIPEFLMYYCVSLYFKNGGGSCYIVSIGDYKDKKKPAKDDLEAGLALLEKEDEPTLILLTDAVNLNNQDDYYELCHQALKRCNKLGDRFAIFDVLDGNDGVDKFRNKIGTEYLKYGAAYHPFLQTTLNYHYLEPEVGIKKGEMDLWELETTNGIVVGYTGSGDVHPKIQIKGGKGTLGFEVKEGEQELIISNVSENTKGKDVFKAWGKWKEKEENKSHGFDITVKGTGSDKVATTGSKPLTKLEENTWELATSANGITVSYTGSGDVHPKIQIKGVDGNETPGFEVKEGEAELIISNVSENTKGKDVVKAWGKWKKKEQNKPHGFDITEKGSGKDTVEATEFEPLMKLTLASIKSTQTALYNQIKTALTAKRVVLPPSAAVAGVYARVDRERGVWKAPANVSLSAVIEPVSKITHEEQENLNIDPTAGKSINAIREFTGKGTLIWGARTLAGNDNEWRYISVRRLFNMIEESTKKATSFAVFEPNDATTWLKVKGMIESYLYGLWEQGALAGPTSEAAYFVNVGLGKTMTTQDVLEGRMIVEIGVAAVRPAEFIIIRFTHKMQEA